MRCVGSTPGDGKEDGGSGAILVMPYIRSSDMVFRSGGVRTSQCDLRDVTPHTHPLRRACQAPHPPMEVLAEPIWIWVPLELLGALGEEQGEQEEEGCRCGPVMNAGPTDLRSSPADWTAQQVTQIA
ncbi:unnamed protein product [Lota lota]